jgi:hypothetical protein
MIESFVCPICNKPYTVWCVHWLNSGFKVEYRKTGTTLFSIIRGGYADDDLEVIYTTDKLIFLDDERVKKILLLK